MSETVSATTATESAPCGSLRSAWAWKQVFASLFTPSWSLGLLLFACLFLPAYRGCNSQVVYLSEAVTSDPLAAGEVYKSFLLTWPLLFGLMMSLGTLVLAWTSDPRRASILWWSFAGLIFLHTTLLVAAIMAEGFDADLKTAWTWQEFSLIACWIVPTIGLPVILFATYRYCRNWFSAAMWVQLALALTAAVCATVVMPTLLFADELLIGGKILIAGSVGLIVSTIVQLLDGHRALTRKPTQSPLQLNLKSMLLLMAVGGLACAWVGACVLI